MVAGPRWVTLPIVGSLRSREPMGGLRRNLTLSESLEHEVRAFGIRVVLIEPPYTKTNLDASAGQAEGRIDAYARDARALRRKFSIV